MSFSEKVFITIPSILLIVLVSDAMYAKPAVDMFYNECRYVMDGFNCQFNWRAFTIGMCHIGLAYVGVVIFGNSDNLRNPQGESIGNDC